MIVNLYWDKRGKMGNEKKNNGKPFDLMDCALITLATGKRAMNLRELREYLTLMVSLLHGDGERIMLN
jgi:hypothetical protein